MLALVKCQVNRQKSQVHELSPFSPLLLAGSVTGKYEGEVGLQRELHLKTMWQILLAIVKGE